MREQEKSQIINKLILLLHKHIDNINIQTWNFFCKEIGKLDNIIFAYDKIFTNIEINKGEYGHFFSLILDSLSISLITRLDLFFQKREDVFSLYSFTKIEKSSINKIRKQAERFIIMRNNKIGHLTCRMIHKKNFEFFTKKGIGEIKKIVKEIENLLNTISKKYDFNQEFIYEWIGLNEETECIFNDLQIKK